jgi:hypothetical protein
LFKYLESRIAGTASAGQDAPPPGLLAFYWHFVRQNRGWYAVMFATSLAVALVDTVIPLFIGRVVALMEATDRKAALAEQAPLLLGMVAVVLVLRPLVLLADVAVRHNMLIPGATNLIRWQSHWHVVRQSLTFFQNDFAGRIANRVMQTANSLRESVMGSIRAVWYIIAYGATALVLMAVSDWRLALPTAVWFAGYVLFLRYFVPRMRDLARASSEVRSQVMARVAPLRSRDSDSKKREGDAKAQAQAVAAGERAEGLKQFDYLRRLAARIRHDSERQEEAARRTPPDTLGRFGNAQVRAIGVLGTDTYDKVAVLRALRKEFPRAVFFTTDLDARMLDVEHYDWTRNVVVASSFGLELTPCLQKDVPPFRGTYQTSAYLAARLAVHNVFPGDETGRATLCPEYPRQFWLPPHHGEPVDIAGNGDGYRLRLNQITIDKWLAAPRLFEIGRTEPLSLLDTPPQYQRAVGNVHPEADPLVPSRGALLTGLFVASVLFGGLLLVGHFRRWLLEARGFARDALCDGERRHRGWWLVVGVVAVVLIVLGGLLLCAYLEAAAREGEPFRWVEGLSTWPSEGLRVIALLVAAIGLFAACGRS